MVFRTILVLSALAGLTACGNGKLAGLDNAELAAKKDECIINKPTSPGRVTGCENIRKECEKRREKGNFAC